MAQQRRPRAGQEMTLESHNAFHGIIHGRVQGVGFRVYARQAALRHGITGWVKNLSGGRVEVYAEGDELSLTEFLTDLYRGPVLSHVKDIELDWKYADKQFEEFGILR